MTLTYPLSVQDLQATFPRETRGMEVTELQKLLQIEERALRATFGVTRVDTRAGVALADAMKAAWPSFLQQIRQVAAESTGAAGYQVTYNRAGVIDFVFPSFVGGMLSEVADVIGASAAPSSTQLTR